uniref:protein-disulfide reductase n=1 Tax=Caenorhabditis japonica TaxID=281687 RepID=A0A8R1HY59_CAEJA
MSELLAGATLKNQQGLELNAAEHLRGKVVGLYFSASWCPPCRAFTPKLKRFFEKIRSNHPEFEVIFVSSDRSSENLVAYFKDHHGDWTFIPYGRGEIKPLKQKYEVNGIPTMRITRANGDVVIWDARGDITNKGEDAESLWKEWMSKF